VLPFEFYLFRKPSWRTEPAGAVPAESAWKKSRSSLAEPDAWGILEVG
jgi:hypothetical protein